MNYSRFSKNNYMREYDALTSTLRGSNSRIIPRSVTGKQQLTMERMLKSDLLSDWDRKFLIDCLERKKLSNKQKSKLNEIYLKTNT